MTPVEALTILAAATAAGAMNAVVGAGTLITFPTLLALGVPPVVANVSNTVGLVPGGIAAAYGFRGTLVGRGRLLARLAVASAAGGVVGGALLLALPAGTFAVVVPLLLVLAGVLAAVQPRVASAVARRRHHREAGQRPPGSPVDPSVDPSVGPTGTVHLGLVAGVAATGVYGGYFGAAQGVILLALLGVFLAGGMTQVNRLSQNAGEGLSAWHE